MKKICKQEEMYQKIISEGSPSGRRPIWQHAVSIMGNHLLPNNKDTTKMTMMIIVMDFSYWKCTHRPFNLPFSKYQTIWGIIWFLFTSVVVVIAIWCKLFLVFKKLMWSNHQTTNLVFSIFLSLGSWFGEQTSNWSKRGAFFFSFT